MTPAGGARLAHYGIRGDAPSRWVSELAEELAQLCAAGHPTPWLLGDRLKAAAAAHGIGDVWFVTQLVAHEWDRLGIARIPLKLEAGGW
jgi:hypothetical protein